MMALTTLIMTVLMVAVASGYSSGSDNNFPWGHFHYVPSLPLPQLPSIPGVSFPPLPVPPPLLMPTNVHVPDKDILFPSVEDIIFQGHQPGSNYNGIAIFSTLHGTRGEDGEVHRQGEAAVLHNNNGQVTVEKVNGPGSVTVVTAQSKNPPFSNFKAPQFKPSMEFKMPKMEPFRFESFTMKPFKPITFKPINIDDVRHYVPEKGEHYTGHAYHVESHSSDVNGVKNSGGSLTAVLNNNGHVNAEDLAYHQGPEDES